MKITAMDKRIKQLVSQIENEAASEQEAKQIGEQMEKLWEASSQYKQQYVPKFDADKNLAQLKQRIAATKSPAKTRRLNGWRIAAAILFLAVGTWLANTYFFVDPRVQTFYNDQQEVVNLSLSDGSQVSLHPGGQLNYPKRFSRKTDRNVQLSGTAFFEVEANPKKPFIIQTPNTQVRVVGTAFLLKAEPDAIETTVKVEEGKVYFLDKSTRQEIFIPAKQTGICQAGGILFQEPTEIKGPLEVKMRNQPLARLFAQIERHHSWTFNLDKEIRQCPLTGTFDVSNPEKVLRQINGFSSFNVSREEENIYRISGTCP